MKPMVIYYPQGHQKHYFPGHPERPERVENIKESLMESGYWEESEITSPLDVSFELLSAVHTPEYLKILERTKQKAQLLDPDTYATRASWQLALNAAGGALAVVDQVWDRKADTGFALTRPPGHHATRSSAMGFCLINNIAVAAEYLLQEKGAEKIVILDLDLHHGNGTQDIFWERGDVSYISIHQAPFYPGTGSINETGFGAGVRSTLNIPIPASSGDEAYLALLERVVLPYLDEQDPQFLLISYGFDTHWKDPLGGMLVSADCVYRLISQLQDWAQINCSGRIAVILEGGYDLDAARACGEAVAAGLAGKPFVDDLGPSLQPEDDTWMNILRNAEEILGYPR
jgi:acetoin utilization deacetylase AcuC-like enzyme